MQEQEAISRYMAEIGRKGGRSTSPAKQAASRRNGARNFRTVKTAPEPAPIPSRAERQVREGLWADQD